MIRMMVVAGIFAGIFFGGPASVPGTAQPLYKCADPQGLNSYQSTPCREHEQQVWARELPAASVPVQPNAAAPAGAKPKPPIPAARRTRSGGKKTSRPRHGSAAISLHSDPAACEKAKEKRRKTYEKLGGKRDFETSRAMDNLVQQACR